MVHLSYQRQLSCSEVQLPMFRSIAMRAHARAHRTTKSIASGMVVMQLLLAVLLVTVTAQPISPSLLQELGAPVARDEPHACSPQRDLIDVFFAVP